MIEEPYVKATMITPPEYVGAIMELTQNRRGDARATWSICTTAA